MTTPQQQARLEELREMWERAVERDRHADAVKALVEIEKVDPGEARWSQRLGEAYRRLHKMSEAEEAFVRAMERYMAKGFTPRAVAMAKLVESLNPARKGLLADVVPDEPAAGGAAARPPPLKAPPPLPFQPVPLERAKDASADEVRFVDIPGRSSIEIVLEDVSTVSSVDIELTSSMSLATRRDAPPTGGADPHVELLEPSMTGRVQVGDSLAARALAADGAGGSASAGGASSGARSASAVSGLPEPREPSIDRLATMAAFRLFAGLSRDALAALSAAAELVEFVPGAMIIVRDEPAFALYAIIDGVARVTVRGSSGDVRLGEGDVFGEGCLLDEGTRQADVKAETPLMALRVGKEALDRVTKEHAQIGDALFQLLARRLLTNLMMTSPLFTVFEPKVRLELAQLFEVRRAEPGTVLAERGRRSDGLYVLLAGNVTAKGEGAAEVRVARGTAFGHGSLMGGAPALETVRVATEAVVLRLPAAAFSSLAALYPPALAALSATADEPLPPSRLLE